MKLIIDIGNTWVKYAVFDTDQIVALRQEKTYSEKTILEMVAEYSGIKKVFVSSVRKINPLFRHPMTDEIKFITFDNSIRLPLTIGYETPETLGKDRIAAAVGAQLLMPGQNVLAIDAGTCITFDMVTSQGEYLGGSINPGIRMRYEALNTFTGNLPLIKPDMESDVALIGKSTDGSIRSGVQKAILAEVDGLINHYMQKFHDLRIIVTGGDYKYFDKYLKNNIFAAPNLVLTGLKKILDFNEDN